MKCKMARKCVFSGFALFIVLLMSLISLATLAQTAGAGQASHTASYVSLGSRLSYALLSSPNVAFALSATYGSAGSQGDSVAVGDFNLDGNPDLAVSNSCYAGCSESAVGVLLGNGDGTFQSAVPYAFGHGGCEWVTVADVNGDGKPDLLGAIWEAPYVPGGFAVLMGNGDGTFEPAVIYASPVPQATSLAVSDFNGDGKLDVASAHFWVPEGLSVFLGNGDGTFQPPLTYNLHGSGSFSVAAADINGDQKPDLVVACYYTIDVLLGNGDGTFQPPVSYSSGGPRSLMIALADLNWDGKNDLIVTNGNGVGVLLGNGDGTFQPAVTYGSGGWSVTVADVNGDSQLDLLVTSGNRVNVNVLLGLGDGTFRAQKTYGAGGHSAFSVAVADLNDDRKPDLAVANKWSSTVGVLLNTTARLKTSTSLTTSGTPSFVGQPVTFTAAVISSYRTIPDGELVTFFDGSTMLGSGKLSNGTATFTTASLSVKVHFIKATYAGDEWSLISTSKGSVTQAVEKYPTTTVLNSSLNPSVYGQAVTFTATVTPTGPYPLTGKVKFWDGTVGIGSVTLSGGVAQLTKSKLTVGTHPITAQYLGDATSDKSTSPVLNQVVQ